MKKVVMFCLAALIIGMMAAAGCSTSVSVMMASISEATIYKG